MRRLVVAIIVGSLASFALALSPTDAKAQESGFDIQQFTPAPSQWHNYFGVQSSRIHGSGGFEFTLLGNYANDPLVLRDENGNRLGSVVSDQFGMNLLGSVGIGGVFELGLDLPMIVFQDGDDLGMEAGNPGAAGFGVGDLRIIPKFQFLDPYRRGNGGVGIALAIDIFTPTGAARELQGEGAARVLPKFILEFISPSGPRLAFNAGVLFRSNRIFDDLAVTNEFDWGVGVGVPVGQITEIVTEVRGRIGLTGEPIRSETAPVEAMLGVKIRLPSGALFQGGFGTGLVEGYGSPDYRVMGALGYAHIPNPDRDGDGIPNHLDLCPDDPEDFDGFEDEDGCPDPDNDGDGIPDIIDQCPNDPEDFNGFEDEDGCPEGHLDYDGDGIPNALDACPFDPEDFNGFEDEDGCPEGHLDYDGDGILNADDACPFDPEDFNGFEDEDGCPEGHLDYDGDGIPNALDACPFEPETFNGFEDEDGCPDEGPLQYECDRIVINDRIYFAFDSDRIEERSFPLLESVGNLLRGATFIELIRIEGHTDNVGSASYNLELSRRRAESVRQHLILHGGISESRMVSEGFGLTRPIAENTSRDGRAMNRRVEFNIIQTSDARCLEQALDGSLPTIIQVGGVDVSQSSDSNEPSGAGAESPEGTGTGSP